MSDIYSAPTADLSRVEDNEQKAFYVVSPTKFALLYIGTFSLYTFYWMYKNWSNQKLTTNEDIYPVGRTIFQIFFVHSLFTRIETTGTNKNIIQSWGATLWATIYVLLIFLSTVLDRLAYAEVGSPYTDLAGYGLMVVDFFILFKVQKIINLVCNDAQGVSNERITAANIAWVMLGVILWVLVILGTYSMIAGDPDFLM